MLQSISSALGESTVPQFSDIFYSPSLNELILTSTAVRKGLEPLEAGIDSNGSPAGGYDLVVCFSDTLF